MLQAIKINLRSVLQKPDQVAYRILEYWKPTASNQYV